MVKPRESLISPLLTLGNGNAPSRFVRGSISKSQLDHKNNSISFHTSGAEGKRGLSQATEDTLTPPVP